MSKLGLLAGLMLLLSLPLRAEPKLRWSWAQENCEVLGVCPDSKGNRVALVRRIHWPDGHEAEEAEARLAELRRRAEKEPRFQDPEVMLMQVTGGSERIDWGWDPDFSPAGERLCYSHQARPATGLRILAETLQGNWLEEWSESNHQHRPLVRPQSGFLAAPSYSSDGQSLLYELQAPVNGAWPGTVGAGVYRFAQGESRTLLDPSKEKGLDVLVRVRWVGNQVIALRGTPLEAGSYLSDSYAWDLVAPEKSPPEVLVRLPSTDLLSAPSLESAAGNLWLNGRAFDPNGRRWLDKPVGKVLGSLSPDGRHRALTRGNVLVLLDPAGRETWKTRLPGSAAGLRWSANGRYLAVISTQTRRGQFLKDSVRLYQI